MRVRNYRLVEIGIAVVGVSLLVYGEIVTNRVVRIAAFVIVTMGVIAAAILSTFRDDDT
jgi:hypothetical protein